jgi:pimeloyl-ACP methyl ester carboxylesterase
MVGAAALGAGAAPARAQPGGKTFVLVHGAWHGGWCWRRVADMLQDAGQDVYTPTLTGLGERSHLLNPKINLATHVADVVNVLKWEDLKDIVLVGHSYGGFVISGVAEEMHRSISSLVFLDAFVPQNGESIAALASPAIRDQIRAAVERGDVAMKPPPASLFRVNEKDRPWVDGKCTAHPVATLTDKVALTGAREGVAQRTYIRAKEYPNPTFDKYLAALKERDGWRTYEIACGHDAMVDLPERLTEILMEVA